MLSFYPLEIYFKTQELENWTRVAQRNVDLEISTGICKKNTLFLKNGSEAGGLAQVSDDNQGL